MPSSKTGHVGRKRSWGRMALCVLLFLGGLWCLTNTAAMNFSAGLQSADSWLGQIVQPSSTLAVDVMVALLAAVVFSLLAMGTFRSVVSGILLGIVLLGFAGFSVKNTLGFGMQERVEKAMRIKANADAVINAVKAENQNAKEQHEKHVAWLQEQYKRAEYRKDRNRLLEEIRGASKQHFDVKVEVVDTVMGDPEAEAMANLLGWDLESYILANQLALAILLVVGKVLGFGLSASLWPRPTGPSSSDEVSDAEDELSLDDLSPVSTAISPAPMPAPSNDLGALEAPEKTALSLSAREVSDLDRVRRTHAVKSFISTRMVRISRTQDGLSADEIFRSYSTWARANNPTCDMTQMAFSTICREIGVPKVRHRGLIKYGLRSSSTGSVAAAA